MFLIFFYQYFLDDEDLLYLFFRNENIQFSRRRALTMVHLFLTILAVMLFSPDAFFKRGVVCSTMKDFQYRAGLANPINDRSAGIILLFTYHRTFHPIPFKLLFFLVLSLLFIYFKNIFQPKRYLLR